MTEKQTIKRGGTTYLVASHANSRVVLLQDSPADAVTVAGAAVGQSDRHLCAFSVEVGLRRIMRFYVRPRKRWTKKGEPEVTTRKNNAVIGWSSSPLTSATKAFSGSLYDVVCALVGYGLKVDAVLAAAEKHGWPRDIIEEARERAEETYRYLAEQGWPEWGPA